MFAKQAQINIRYFIPYWKNKSYQDIFPEWVWRRFPYDRVNVGQCLTCANPYDINTGNAFCASCFLRFIVNINHSRCIISDEVLSHELMTAQKSEPQNILNNICEGYPRDYYMLLVCKIYGEIGFLVEDQGHNEVQPITKGKLIYE